MSDEEPKNRRARRAAKARGEGSPERSAATEETGEAVEATPEQIRDRNQRLRQQAAAKRRAKRGRQRAAASAEGLGTGERFEDSLTRSAHAVTKFVQSNASWLQWLFLLGVVGAVAALIYNYRSTRQNEQSGDAVIDAVQAQFGRVEGEDAARSPDRNLVDYRQTFASNEERLAVAAELFEAAKERAGWLAQLGLAGIRYDQGKYADARKAYEAVLDELGPKQDIDARGRAREGIGLSYEAEGKKDEALQAFAELEKEDGFEKLARFHQARVQFTKGERDELLETLKKLRAELQPAAEEAALPVGPPTYLAAAVDDLLRTIDPDAVPDPSRGISPEMLEKLKKQFEEMQKNQPPVPVPAPEAPPESSEPEAPAPEGAPGTPPTADAPPPAPASPAAPAPQAPAPQAPAPQAPAPQAPVTPQETAPQKPTPTPAAPAPAPAPAAPTAPPAAPAPAAPPAGDTP